MAKKQYEKIIVTCGSFDPLTKQELDFLKRCKDKGDRLAVGIHSDHWMKWSQGGVVQPYDERRDIIEGLKIVDEIFTFDDSDGTVCQLLKVVKYCYPYAHIIYVSSEDLSKQPEKNIKGITFEVLK